MEWIRGKNKKKGEGIMKRGRERKKKKGVGKWGVCGNDGRRM